MPAVRRRKECPLCKKGGLLKLSNHLTMVHNITGEKRKNLCHQAKSFPPVTNKVKSGRKRRTCPLCKKPDLLLLSNHIRFVHNITGQARKDLLKVAKAQLKNATVCSLDVVPISSYVSQGHNSTIEESIQPVEEDFILKNIYDRVQQYLSALQERPLVRCTGNKKQYKSQNGESRAEITIRRLQTLNKEMGLNHVSNRVYPSLKGMQGNVATKIQQLVQNLVEEDLATRIHQYFGDTEEVSLMEEEEMVEERMVQDNQSDRVHQQLADTEEVSVMEEEEMEEEIMVQDNHSDKVHKQLADLEPDVANLDDSFDEKLALAAWNRKEFLGKDCEERVTNLPSISDSLREIFPDSNKDDTSKQQRRRFSDELTDEISHVFAYYITKKITPPLAECRRFLVHQKGQEAQRSPKTIQDKVRSLMSKGV